jgi:hypothetical protein
MPGKRSVSRLAESITLQREVVSLAGADATTTALPPQPAAGHASGLRSAPGKSVGAEIESLKSKMLHPALLNMRDIPDDVVGGIEAMVRYSCEQSLNYELRKIFKILDKMTENSYAVLQVYKSLDSAIHFATLAGMNNPNPAFAKLRQDVAGMAKRAKRKANVAAEERRKKMRPFVEDIKKDFRGIDGFSRLATAMYKALMKRSDFVDVLPRSATPRQIKSDIQAILEAIDDEAEASREGALESDEIF